MTPASSSTPATGLFPNERKFVSPETYDAFFAVIERLEATLDAETATLRDRGSRDLALFTRQKRQGFLELNRIMRSLEQTIPSQDILTRLGQFKTRLEANDSMLRIHLSAVQDVTAIIVRVMRDQESDGTYSLAYGRNDSDLE